MSLIRFLIRSSVLLLVLGVGSAWAGPRLDIAIVTDGPSERMDGYIKVMQREVRDLIGSDYNVVFHQGGRYQGGWTLPGIRAAVDYALANRQIEIVVASGLLVSQHAAQLPNRSKPVLAPIVGDANAQGFSRKGNTSGARNLVYLDPFASATNDLRIFRRFVQFTELTIVADRIFLAGITGVDQRLLSTASDLGVNMTIVPVESKADEALLAIPKTAEAILVLPLLRFDDAETVALANGLKERQLPSFTTFGRAQVRSGLLMSNSADTDITRISRRIALNIERLLGGTAAADIDVRFPQQSKLTLNMETARVIGFSPGWELLQEADVINRNVGIGGKPISLAEAMTMAVQANLDIAIQQQLVGAGQADLSNARSALLPQLTAFSEYGLIDEDRAAASFGQNPERRFTAGLRLQQLLYSQDALTFYRSTQQLQLAREFDRERVRLDIALAAARAYLNLLRAQSFESIERDNLKLTKANLERAENRLRIGISGRADVLRWQSTLATNRQTVLKAAAGSRQARVLLNQVLHLPLNTALKLQKSSLNDADLWISDRRYVDYVNNPRDFERFGQFLVERGLRQAPELMALRANNAASVVQWRGARRNYYIPTVAIQGEYRRELKRDGAGGQRGPGLDKNDWQVGLGVELPLFSGGARRAAVDRASAQSQRLALEQQRAAEQISTRIRTSLDAASASYPSIDLSTEAEAAAVDNLEIVTDGYGRGVVSVIDLLDAQNAARTSSRAAANAVYDFLLDYTEVQRAVGQFDYLAKNEDRQQFFAELEQAFGQPATTN